MDNLFRVMTLLLLLCPMNSTAQHGAVASSKINRKTNRSPATVSGYVFALTKGGDIKPARLAKVYMFYSGPIGEAIPKTAEKFIDPSFAADVFPHEVAKGMEEAKEWEADKPYLQDTTRCQDKMERGYGGALLATLRWGGQHKGQIVKGDVDEEGKFELTLPPTEQSASFKIRAPHDHVFVAGNYLVVVSGTAGFYDAYWLNVINVKPGTAVNLKMSDPKMLCRKLDSE
jgi:hypothetical protein